MTRKTEKREDGENPMRERLASNIASSITRIQSCISGRLNSAFAKLGRRTQVALFTIAISVMAAYSLYLILRNTL